MWPNLLRTRRELNELTQTELAVRAGVSLPSIQNMEAGRANPSLKTLQAVFGILGVEILFNVKKDLTPPKKEGEKKESRKDSFEKEKKTSAATTETKPKNKEEEAESFQSLAKDLATGTAKERIGSLFKIIEKVTDKK